MTTHRERALGQARAVKIPTITDVRRFINDHPDVGRWVAEALRRRDG